MRGGSIVWSALRQARRLNLAAEGRPMPGRGAGGMTRRRLLAALAASAALPAACKPGAGKLVFAGEHLSDEWFGFMNGAAQTGRLAARAVLDAVGRA